MNKIIHGDSLERLKDVADESVDLVCTDPPYGYSFMGKAWDKALPDIGIFKECLRVLKPGAFAFVMSAPRSDVCARMMMLLEDAGFNIGFTPIYWTYASGFPKAMNIGKMVDKRMGAVRERVKVGEAAKGSPDYGKYSGEIDADGALSTEAKALEGSYGGFQPKPAVEVIIVAMKPLSEKTFVDQALKNGKGITWLDDARIPTNGDVLDAGGRGKHGRGEGYGFEAQGEVVLDQTKGRFPANLLVSDDVLNDGRMTKSPKPYTRNADASGGILGKPKPEGMIMPGIGDEGGYSRFFSLDSWAQNLPFLQVPRASKREKNEGLADHEAATVSDGRTIAADNAFQRGKTERKNIHPTCKPVTLMSYLITLGSRPRDVILDPFLGSGTTAVAAKQLGREYIGIEREAEYVAIAQARIEAINPSLL